MCLFAISAGRKIETYRFIAHLRRDGVVDFSLVGSLVKVSLILLLEIYRFKVEVSLSLLYLSSVVLSSALIALLG